MEKKIKWGRMVKPTRLAIQNGVLKQHDKGLVLGYYKNEPKIWVVKIGQRIPLGYCIDFWQQES